MKLKLGLSASILLFIVLLFPTEVIVLSSGNQSCRLRDKPFSLRWRHSVEKQWWQEDYEIEQGEFLLTTTELETFGAGTPSSLPLTAKQQPGSVSMLVNRRLKELYWVVSPNTYGSLTSENAILPLYKTLPAYSEVHIHLRKAPLIKKYLYAECLKRYRKKP